MDGASFCSTIRKESLLAGSQCPLPAEGTLVLKNRVVMHSCVVRGQNYGPFPAQSNVVTRPLI